MNCIFCGTFFATASGAKACPACERAMERLGLRMSPDRLLELIQAERDGRMVVLPCKMGDTLYHVDPILRTVEPWKTIALDVVYSAHPFEGNREMPIKFLSEIISDGKELFLTREEAEAARGKEATP